MSHSETHAHDHHHHAHSGPRPYFPEAEWQQFHDEDIAAGKAIIILISGIFTLGLLIYTIVALAVAAKA